MSTDENRRKGRWHPNDRLGLTGALLFPVLLAALWLAGLGPFDQQACRSVTYTKALQIDFDSTADGVILSGAVATDRDRTALLTAAAATWGEGKVTDRLRVDAFVPALTWSSDAAKLFDKLKSIDAPARFKITDDSLQIAGAVADEATREAIGRDAGMLVSATAKVYNDLAIRKPPPVEEKPLPPPPPPVAATPPAPPPPAAPAEPAVINGLIKHTLPNGAVIEVAPEGVEMKVIGFIEDTGKAVDKNLWFEFDRLYFDFDSANLNQKSMAQIEAMTEVLKAYPNSAIKIGGYTDNVGDPDYNLKLSSERAGRVVKELVARTIAPDRLEWEGYGQEHPQADNATEEGRAKNRRTAVSVRRR